MYLNNFNSNEDILKEYAAPEDALNGATVYLAWYGYGSYSGSSLVIFEKDGQLYEVNGSHCSCTGLEDQWQPEETSWEALKLRKIFEEGNYSEYEGEKEAQAIGIGQGDWGPNSRYLNIAVHKFDQMNIGSHIWADPERGVFYDRAKSLERLELEKERGTA